MATQPLFTIAGAATNRLYAELSSITEQKPVAAALVPKNQLLLTPGNVLTKDNIDGFGRLTGKPMYAFKVSGTQGDSPMHCHTQPVLKCEVGAHLSVPHADKDWRRACGAGVNVATLDWCLNNYDKRHIRWTRRKAPGRTIEGLRKSGYKLWLVRFFAYDVACIPNSTDGKIRLTHCVVYKEIVSTSSYKATMAKLTLPTAADVRGILKTKPRRRRV